MTEAVEDPELTRVFVLTCFDVGYRKVEIEPKGQHIFAAPIVLRQDHKKVRKLRAPLWQLVELFGSLGKGCPAALRGDHVLHNMEHKSVRFVPCIAVNGMELPASISDSESAVASRVQDRMLYSTHSDMYWCSHGVKGRVICLCWNNWGKIKEDS